MGRKRVLVVFPTMWDSTQLEYCRPLWEDRFEVLFAGPNDEDCPWDFDILGFVDDAVRRYAGRIDGVLSSSDYPGATVAGAIADALGLPGTSPGLLLQISHKYYSRVLQQKVVPEAVPDFRAIDSARPEEQAGRVNYPCFIKPVKGAFSMLARRIDSAEELVGFLARPEISEFTGGYLRLFDKLLKRYTAFGKSGAWFLAEELLQGVQVTVEGYRRGDTVRILGISDSVLHPEYGSFLRFSYPSSLPLHTQERMADIARRTVCGFNLRETLFNMEMMYDPAADRIGIIEINPRLCGQFADLYQKVDGINGYQVALALASGEQVPLNTQGAFRMAASFPLRVFGPARVDRAPDEKERRGAEGLFPETRVWSECRTGEILGHGVDVEDGFSRRYAVVNLGGDNLDEMIKRLHQIEERLAFHLKAIRSGDLQMTNEKSEGYELRLERLLDAPRANVWRCWTEAKLLEQWFAPRSWTTEVKTLEPRPGGASHIVMRGPDGEESDGVGVFLEAVPEQRLVFTNAFTSGWIPASKPAVVPFMTTIVEMSDEGGKTRYVVCALHWTEEARKQHEEMGFHEGWGETTGQLEALARTL